MRQKYIKRSLDPIIKKAVSEFPSVILTGPRQSGKTTTLKYLFAKDFRYLSFDPPDIRAAAKEDPRGFLDMYPPPVIFDEIQYVPDLLPYIKDRIDMHRARPGQYLLTGSQNLLLMEKITETLAGRTAVLRLLPMSRREIEGRPGLCLPWEKRENEILKRKNPADAIWNDFLRGNYPELVANPERDINLWHSAYVQTYLERDVRSMRQIGDLTQFQAFLKGLASRNSQLLNLADMARDLGVALNTAKAWLSILEATYQVIVLRPYFANIGKRLVKTPKVFFTDLGTLCYLTGLKDPAHVASGPMGGAIMETAVLTEIVKTLTHRGIDPNVYFWRTSSGSEVDIVVEDSGGLVPIEVKLSSTPRPVMAGSIRSFQDDFNKKTLSGYVIHPGNVRLPIGPNVTALPFNEL